MTTNIKLDNLKNKVKKLSNNDLTLKVGFLDSKQAKIAIIQEFGATINVTPKMRGWFYHNFGIQKSNKPIVIPARPFMRSTIDKNKKLWKDILINLLKTDEPEKALDKLGSVMQGDIRETISNNDFTPNAPFTIMKKGRDQPLIDTGEMLRAVDYEVSK